MTLSTSVRDREKNKFFETTDGETAVRVGLFSGPPSKQVDYDAISVNYPNATTETFSYYQGGLAGTLVLTVTVVYTDATKEDISTVEFV
jgi:hypothetical protein